MTKDYLHDELTAVLKGRGVTSLDQYLSMERTGRKTRFTAPMREPLPSVVGLPAPDGSARKSAKHYVAMSRARSVLSLIYRDPA